MRDAVCFGLLCLALLGTVCSLGTESSAGKYSAAIITGIYVWAVVALLIFAR